MFTGLIQGLAQVKSVEQQPGLSTLTFSFPDNLLRHLCLGASVAIEGVCLSVVSIHPPLITFNAIAETLAKTTLGELKKQDWVHVERSARLGDEIGGHLVSGHVQGKAPILRIETPSNNYVLYAALPQPWNDYLFTKGYIALNGTSLTLVDVSREENYFTVHLIPDTLKRTMLGQKKVGDFLNFEVDYHTQIIVNTVKNYLSLQAPHRP